MSKLLRKRMISLVVILSLVIAPVIQSPKTSEAAGDTGSWTVAVYMCGSDLESGQYSASSDIIEMLDVKTMPDSVNVIIETGGSPRWFFKELATSYYQELGLPEDFIASMNIPEISSDYLQRYRIHYNQTYSPLGGGTPITYATLELLEGQDKVALNNPALETQTERSIGMGETAVLKDFLTYSQNHFPSKKNMVTLWNHGGGTVGGACMDYYHDYNGLSLLELQEAFDSTCQTLSNHKYDLISFDACLMATYETMAAMDSSTRYLVSALTSEPGYGHEHSGYLKELSRHAEEDTFTGKELGDAVVKAFQEYYCENGTLAEKTEVGTYDKEAMLANFNLNKIDESLSVFDSLSRVLLYLEQDEEGMEQMMQEVYKNAIVDGPYDLVSLKLFLEKTKTFAQKRAETLNASSFTQENYLGQKYEHYITLAQQLYDLLFTPESGTISSEYDGWEKDNRYHDMGAISLFMPTPQTAKGTLFADSQYLNLTISSNYAIFAYHLGILNQNGQCKEPEQKLTWHSESGTYHYSIQEDLQSYIKAIGCKTFVSGKDGNYYMVEDVSSSKGDYEKKPGIEYFTFNGVPIYAEHIYDNFYSTSCRYNGTKATLYFWVDENGTISFSGVDLNEDIYGSDIYPLNEGDVITPNVFVSESSDSLNKANKLSERPIESAAYTARREDFIIEDDEEICLLPMEKKSDANDNCEYIFYTKNNGINGSYIQTRVNHNDILNYSKATVTLEKSQYTMTGKEIKPKVTVSSGNKVYEEGKDYKVTYGNNIGTGTGIVTVTGLGQYSCVPETNKTFQISEPTAQFIEKTVVKTQIQTKTVTKTNTVYQSLPSAVKITSAKKKKKTITVKYKKKSGKNIGYQVAYTTKKSGKKIIAGTTAKTIYKIKNVKNAKKYYVYVRAYITKDGKKLYGTWSKRKTVKK